MTVVIRGCLTVGDSGLRWFAHLRCKPRVGNVHQYITQHGLVDIWSLRANQEMHFPLPGVNYISRRECVVQLPRLNLDMARLNPRAKDLESAPGAQRKPLKCSLQFLAYTTSQRWCGNACVPYILTRFTQWIYVTLSDPIL